MSWEEDQEFERGFWSDCANTFTEEIKQLSYGYKMGLTAYANAGKWPCYNLEGKHVLDIGGGPVSMLLKCENRGRCRVVDPCPYPTWIRLRYMEVGIEYYSGKGEDIYSPIKGDEEYNLIKNDELVNGTWTNGRFYPTDHKETVGQWDEVWIYNVLQHVEDPELIIKNAQVVSSVIRMFEWIDLPPHEGHPHELKEAELNKWLGGTGTTEWLNENNCYGRAYYGVFVTNN